MARRKTTTFGVIPSIKELEAAFEAEGIEKYHYKMKGVAADFVSDCGFDVNDELTPRQLSKLVHCLMAAAARDDGSDTQEQLAADILSTLGFEWI